MNQHYSEADLLETYYMQPGQSMPVMMHLADCSECAARYERLERKLRSLAACEHDKPETFWARQRISVLRRIGERPSSFARTSRAAAAVLALVLGGFAVWQQVDKSSSRPVVQTVVQAPQTASLDDSITRSLDDSTPWESEPLDEYSSMVAWESWVEDEQKKNSGDKSL
jgi:predicted anti-sigma-YlaC factor YlaD